MDKYYLIILISLLFLTDLISQTNRKKVKNGDITEIYYVNTEGERHGEYKFKYKRFTQVKGMYENDLKTGKWHFNPDRDFEFTGFYNKGLKDSTWYYYYKDEHYLNFNTINGSITSFYENNIRKATLDSTDNGFIYKEYYKNGYLKKQLISDTSITIQKRFDVNNNLTDHISFKNGLPYNIHIGSQFYNFLKYEGDLENGTGEVIKKSRDKKSDKFYISEIYNIKNSIPHGHYKEFDNEGNTLIEGEYQNGYLTDDWEVYNDKTLEIDSVVKYSISDSIKRDTINNIGIITGAKFCMLEEIPKFQGGSFLDFRNYVTSRLEYPKVAQKQNIQGRVVVEFNVNSIGQITNIEVVNSAHILLDNEAIRVMKNTPYWRPGFQLGVPVSAKFTIPFVFILN